ncbi:MAG: flagellar biosynthetic protein FliO [bacterium]|nr:flagellar biosynthetic protein FliO [bacterium]
MHMLTTLALLQIQTTPQGPDLSRYFAVLGGVAVMLTLTAFGLRKLISKGSFGLKGAKRSLEIVEVLPLGSRRQIAVVRCYDRTFALGLGEKSVSLLAELDAEMVQNENKKTPGAQQAPQNRFASGLHAILKPQERAKARTQAQLAKNSDDGFERLLDHAQHQLEVRRTAETQNPQTQARVANGGLEELC